VNEPLDPSREAAAEAALQARAAFVRTEALIRLRDFFREHRVDAVFLKGAVTAPLLYPVLAARGMRDVDVWIRPDAEAERAQRLLREHGWALSRELPPGHHHLDPLLDLSRALTIEIHTNLAAPPLPDAALDLLWSRRVPGEFLPRLDDASLVVHQVLHALNDPLDGPLNRDLREIHALHERLSPEQRQDLSALAEKLGCAEALRTMLALARQEVLAAPPTNPAVRLAVKRLAHDRPTSRLGKLQRHLDAVALRLWQHDPNRSWCSCRLRAEAQLVLDALAGTGQRLRREFAPRFQRAPGVLLDLGEGTLLHDRDTGAVHLLNPTAARLARAAEHPAPPAALRAATPELAATDFRQALIALETAGVLRRR
jgi:Uncharacterised nucleotidyltransferase